MIENLKIIIEKHADGFVAYPLGFKDVIVGKCETCGEALANVESAIHFHLETFGENVREADKFNSVG